MKQKRKTSERRNSLIYGTSQNGEIYNIVNVHLPKIRRKENILQCRVASDGNGVDVAVVRSELAPFSSSSLIFFSHM
jgi:hypothetical protein